MKIKKQILIFICISLLLLPLTFSQNLVTGDYSNMNGIQVYFITSSNVYLFGSFNGSSTSITATLYLFLSDTQSKIDAENGVWAGVGFGSSDMYNSDIVMCTYSPSNKFNCYDNWSNSEDNPKSDTSLGGKNDITSSSGTITTISVSSYKTLVTFTFTKDISNVDKYDWGNFSSWQTNKGGISGAYGYLNGSKTPLEHPAESKRLYMIDGNGYRSSISVNLGENAVSPTTSNTSAVTTNGNSASPTNTTTTTTTPTVTTTATITTPNSSKNLKLIDAILVLFSIFLIIFI